MNTSAQNRKIADVLRSLRDQTLIPTPDFQRRAVWTNKDKIAFIETILTGFPFPEIYVASGDVDTTTGVATDVLVDGQQRVRTLQEYFEGRKPFSRAGLIKRYKDLDEEEKRNFLNYDVAVRHLGQHDEGVIREIFRRMNATSYDLNDFERYNAVYLGEFKDLTEELSQNDIFPDYKIFSAADIRRMKDLSYVASLIATMMSDYFNRDDEIEDFLEQYNEEFPQKAQMRERFEEASRALLNLDLPPRSRAWRKADFYTLFVEIDRLINRNSKTLDFVEAGQHLTLFFDAVDEEREGAGGEADVSAYYQTTLQNTNDRSQRIARGALVQSLLAQHAS